MLYLCTYECWSDLHVDLTIILKINHYTYFLNLLASVARDGLLGYLDEVSVKQKATPGQSGFLSQYHGLSASLMYCISLWVLVHVQLWKNKFMMTFLEAPHHQEEIFVFGVIFQTETASSLNFIEGRTSDQNTLTCSHARLEEQYSTYTKIVLIKANPFIINASLFIDFFFFIFPRSLWNQKLQYLSDLVVPDWLQLPLYQKLNFTFIC